MTLDADVRQRLAALDLASMRQLCRGPDLRMARAYCWFVCTVFGAACLVVAGYCLVPGALFLDEWRWPLAALAVLLVIRSFQAAANAARPGREPRWLLELFGRRELRDYRARIGVLRRQIESVEGSHGFLWRLAPMLDRRKGAERERLIHVLRISREQPREILDWVQPVEYLELVGELQALLHSQPEASAPVPEA